MSAVELPHGVQIFRLAHQQRLLRRTNNDTVQRCFSLRFLPLMTVDHHSTFALRPPSLISPRDISTVLYTTKSADKLPAGASGQQRTVADGNMQHRKRAERDNTMYGIMTAVSGYSNCTRRCAARIRGRGEFSTCCTIIVHDL